MGHKGASKDVLGEKFVPEERQTGPPRKVQKKKRIEFNVN